MFIFKGKTFNFVIVFEEIEVEFGAGVRTRMN